MDSSKFDGEADVIILGSGIAGSTLALILARQGVRVLLLDNAVHPRFALGESTLRPASLWMKALAARYSVPELDVIANANKIADKIAPTSGVKRGFGFLFHRSGTDRAERAWLGNIPAVFLENDALEGHLFRQDIDAYLYHAALAAGVTAHVRTQVRHVDIDENGVLVHTAQGKVFRGDYIVDGSGSNSVLAQQFGLREEPTSLHTQSRTLFTHFVGVRPYDECDRHFSPALPWHSCTMHHLFDGGWMWVIPFDNHSRSTNRLCSVGVNLDLRQHPPTGATPEAEWEELMKRYPAVARQFENATPVQPWVSTGRLQYSSTGSVGERYCLLSHAFGAVDALFSRGLVNTFQALNTTATLLLKAVKDRDFSAARFAPLEAQQRGLLEIHDLLVSGSYRALRSPVLWEAWLGLWSLTEVLTSLHIELPLHRFAATAQVSELEFDDLNPAACIAHHSEARDMLQRCVSYMDDLQASSATEEETLQRLEAELQSAHRFGFDYELVRSVLAKANFTALAARYFIYEEIIRDLTVKLDRFLFRRICLGNSAATTFVSRKLAQLLARAENPASGTSTDAPKEIPQFPFPAVPGLKAAVDLDVKSMPVPSHPGVSEAHIQKLISAVDRLHIRVHDLGAPQPYEAIRKHECMLREAGWEVVTVLDTPHDSFHLHILREGEHVRAIYLSLITANRMVFSHITGTVNI